MSGYKSFPFYKQLNSSDCGLACIRMIAKYYGRSYSASLGMNSSIVGRSGMSLLSLSQLAEKKGFRTRGVRMSLDTLMSEVNVPCILHWSDNHFVVFLPTGRFYGRKLITVADPAVGIVKYTREEFLANWIKKIDQNGDRNNSGEGAVLLLEPTNRFYDEADEGTRDIGWSFVLKYLRKNRWQIIQVFMSLIITSIFQLIFPYLTQSIVDTGINTQNLQYVTVVLIAQLMLVFSRTIVDFIRSRLLLQISVLINVSVLTDFWIKVTRLPMSYFDQYHTGDTLQRITDNKKIQGFLTGTALSTFFSFVNLLIFSIVLMMYDKSLFIVFIIGSFLYFLWIQVFMPIRRRINYEIFRTSTKENNITMQLIQGMPDIKLNGAEQLKRWDWERIQSSVFKLNLKNLSYNQIQQAGALLINQGKDIVITFMVADLVIRGRLTLGAMLAIQFIIGQLSGPIEQFIGFIQSAQDTRMSLERINELHKNKDEEDINSSYINHLPTNRSIRMKDVSFSYPGSNGEVLSNLDIVIPEGKVTAIVGGSGSGKTTILKLLLKFYDSYEGDIFIGDSNLKNIGASYWRTNCGAVLQDGYIFNDSIFGNIAVGDDNPDYENLVECCRIANVLDFIESLPNSFNSILGSQGVGVSQGQKQRILIARALYKNPKYLFFDEATNALDANNEKVIVENLEKVFKGRTVIVVAHRLSTVKNADKIIVLEKGIVTEEGTHDELSSRRGNYFELVKNQLQLGN
ncbi:peptidase domain-containing ABC transporter [Chitinophaga polysaccharea]|uniref:peptidase domain-containing ABC transporter n=1 Tax=Chitinophaga polysaccharea TaxID=1293035 RepID=UPI001B3B1F06|nr:peptidase domain-containing ABC transporter [Chitinophaga polysaccharea]